MASEVAWSQANREVTIELKSAKSTNNATNLPILAATNKEDARFTLVLDPNVYTSASSQSVDNIQNKRNGISYSRARVATWIRDTLL